MSGIKLSRAVAKAMPLFGIRFSRELAAADVWNQTKQHYGRLHYQWKQCPGGNLSSDITILQQAELDVNQSLSLSAPLSLSPFSPSPLSLPLLSLPPLSLPLLSLPPLSLHPLPPPPPPLSSLQSLSVAAGPVSVFLLASSFFFDVGSYHPLSRNCLEVMLHFSLSLSLSGMHSVVIHAETKSDIDIVALNDDVCVWLAFSYLITWLRIQGNFRSKQTKCVCHFISSIVIVP